MGRVIPFWVCAGLFLSGPAAAAAASAIAQPALTQLRARLDHADTPAARVEASWALADELLNQGLVLQAERTLRDAGVQATDAAHGSGTALRLGAVLTAAGKYDEARAQLEAAELNESSLSTSDQRRLHEVLGRSAVEGGDLVAAERAFNAAADSAHAAGDPVGEMRARINALRTRVDRKEIAGLEDRLQSLDSMGSSLPGGQESAVLRLSLGELFERAVREFRSPVALRARALANYTRAQQEAAKVSTRAYAAGLMGALYEDAGRTGEALQLTSQAIALAQSVDAQDQLYRWEWQAARLERQKGESTASAQAIDSAVFTLSGIRSDVLQSSRQAFATRIEPVYLEYADVHLRQAAALPEGSPEQQHVLRDVRDQLESLKQAEVQDYFNNGCVTSGAASKSVSIPGTAVIYPILLGDRTEVLIESGDLLRRFSSPVSRGELTATVRRLRIGLEQPSAGDAYRQPAQSLYKWLLAPAAQWLEDQHVTTLVFVPSGPLRTIPLGALLDGNTFVVERYAIATTPAITLIPTLTAPVSNHVLVAGLTESVQGFAGLPMVGAEMATIGSIFPSESLKDESFKLTSIRSDLSKTGFSVAHLATHGEFSADHRQSFILTYDSRLTMDGLQAALGKRQDPLDLLVLSACSTAAGDDRAALGLAGVAIQAGARSALASLWSISDEATAALMGSFYQSRKSGGETKAQSLRDAQLALLQKPEYRHPSYWAPYLLVGNWL
jgi:CHAT domain-containing protein